MNLSGKNILQDNFAQIYISKGGYESFYLFFVSKPRFTGTKNLFFQPFHANNPIKTTPN